MRRLAEDVYLYLDDEAGFIGWCHDNPAGFFWNCRNKAGEVLGAHTLHSASLGGKMCPHFRNRHRETGFEPNLTTRGNSKVVSVNRKTLEEWARHYPRYVAKNCTQCVGV